MIPEALLPKISNFELERLELVENRLNLIAKTAQLSSVCPLCNTISLKAHSSYTRKLSDLPWAGLEVKVILKVHKFFCQNDNCGRKIFSQRFDGLSPYSRRTERQTFQLLAVGIAAGGNRGAKLSLKLGMPISTSTILRLLNAQTVPNHETPRVLGVDDWAIRKGQNYGTILVDLEKQKPIDLLVGRDTEVLQKWLEEHPGVEIISRDRASAYSEAANNAAPDAIQIADRWHLLKNLKDAIKRMLNKHNQASRKVAIEIAEQESICNGSCSNSAKKEHKEPRTREKAANVVEKKPAPSKYELNFKAVKKLQKEGISKRAISRQLGVNRQTVSKYFEYDEYPKKIIPSGPESKAHKYGEYLKKRWEEGKHNYHELWREITKLGFDGAFISVYRYMVKKFPTAKNKDGKTKPAIKVYSARRLSYLLCRDKDKLKPKEDKYLQLLFNHCPEAKTANSLALRYRDILVNQNADLLDKWIEDAIDSGKEVLQNFAKNLMTDYDAIKNACTLEWSNGQVGVSSGYAQKVVTSPKTLTLEAPKV